MLRITTYLALPSCVKSSLVQLDPGMYWVDIHRVLRLQLLLFLQAHAWGQPGETLHIDAGTLGLITGMALQVVHGYGVAAVAPGCTSRALSGTENSAD